MNSRSSNIKSYDYDGGELVVNFHSGRTYRYEDIKPSMFQAFLMAPSKGRFLHRWIIGRKKASEITKDRKSD